MTAVPPDAMKTVPPGYCAQNPPCLYHSGYRDGMAEGAAAVRDRIRQLAVAHHAVTQQPHRCADPYCPAFENDVPFADLLDGAP